MKREIKTQEQLETLADLFIKAQDLEVFSVELDNDMFFVDAFGETATVWCNPEVFLEVLLKKMGIEVTHV